MGSGSGSGKLGPREEILEFLVDASKALYEERIRVVVKERSVDTGIDDHSFPKVTEYRFRYRGISVRVGLEPPSVTVSRTVLGQDVCDEGLFQHVRDACAERHVFQASDDAMLHRQKAEQKTRAARMPKYERLAAKLRGVRPSAKKR